ncbi:MAG: AzlD domain-containing protein [Stenotrophomonas nitritireducens]|uniref:AzlD domain-containing protein n=1 Tax=Stenotrophomonas nitritireducens TaxID=83617 RepID=UPI001AD522A2|nr:AzlD domain-containing protein [Stenotrophomonas nitritireducens]MBN8790856.1 AzlD domain-containing protein [Stenotrophomonas nitritireducens]MBN8796753.1 AzlD domain-containing protein [Stenotrophomonas nitritireducens]
MTLWSWVLLGSVVAWAIKFCGYLVPVRWMESPRMTRVAGTLTIGLLASLTTMNAVSTGQGVVLDARLGALAVAALALLLRLPFLVVVLAGAAAAALLRLL